MDPRRVYSALVFFPAFYLLVRYLPPAAFALFVAAGCLLAQYECYRLYFPERLSPQTALGLGLGLLVTAGFAIPGLLSETATVTFLIAAVLLNQLLSGREIKTGLMDTAVVTFGVLYVAWLLGHLILIRSLQEGIFLVFLVFLVTWANDTGAYLVGAPLGRTPLAPRISPKKTWEGVIGGTVASVAAAFACRAWFLESLTAVDALVIGVVISVTAPLGDLCESLLKRSAGIKDSGSIVPGHGGILDRVDSLIFTAPAIYYYLLCVRTL